MTRGVELLNAKKYDEAVDAFRSAYELFPSPKILLNEGSALFDGNRYAESIEVYKRYLADPGADRKALEAAYADAMAALAGERPEIPAVAAQIS